MVLMSKAAVCIVEGCNNELRPAAIAHGDPFCSTQCAKAHYGTEFAQPERMNVAKPLVHGTEHGFNKGCRCALCKEARRIGRKARASKYNSIAKSNL